jgi:hypothetical protein
MMEARGCTDVNEGTAVTNRAWVIDKPATAPGRIR